MVAARPEDGRGVDRTRLTGRLAPYLDI